MRQLIRHRQGVIHGITPNNGNTRFLKNAHYNRRHIMDPQFDPSHLFANNEQGVFYDPSNLSTMFQDSAGTTPVTAVGQPVGLILDKSHGLVLGPELVTNGDFSNGTTGWIFSTSTGSIESGALRLTITDAYGVCYQNLVPTTVGKTYKVTCNVDSSAGYNALVRLFNGSNIDYSIAAGSVKVATIIFTAVDSFVNVSMVIDSVVIGANTLFDNFSVKELAGNHASQATAASRPLYKETGVAKWTDYDGVDDVLNTTFQSVLGSSCTVARANVGAAPTILTAQTIGTSYADSTDSAGLIVIDRALTIEETNQLTTWLTTKGATA